MSKIFYLYDRFFDSNFTTEHVEIVKIPGFSSFFFKISQIPGFSRFFFDLIVKFPGFSRFSGKVAALYNLDIYLDSSFIYYILVKFVIF